MKVAAYEKRLGWLNVDEKPSKIDGSVFRTNDGRAWMTRRGRPVLVPDDYREDAFEFDEGSVAPLPDEVDVATCSPWRESILETRARARRDIMDVCAVLKADGEALDDVVNLANGDVMDDVFERLVDALVELRSDPTDLG